MTSTGASGHHREEPIVLDGSPSAFAQERSLHAASPTRLSAHAGFASAPAGADSVSVVAPRGLVKAVVGAMILLALYFGRDVFIPLALAALVGFALEPLVRGLTRWKIPRGMAVGLVIVSTLGTLGFVSYLSGTEVVRLAGELPGYQSSIQTKLRALRFSVGGGGVIGDAAKVLDTVGKEVDAALAKEPAPKSRVQRVQIEPDPVSPLAAISEMAGPLVGPLVTAAFVLLLVVLVLIDRDDMRDRLLRLMGTDLHRTTDALGEAVTRVSRFLIAQVAVNISFGILLAAGLWFIGVPGALVWGLMSAVLRFIPYLGPVIGAVLPLTLAFAVDPGWDMLLWTVALIAALELLFNNVVEPLAYGSSTGLSPVAVIMSSAFWAAMWGAAGLLLALPLTVCLAAFGRHLPALAFIDVLLGDRPAFDAATRLYQRLLAGDTEEAIAMADEQVIRTSVRAFYSETALPALSQAVERSAALRHSEHLDRAATGLARVLEDLQAAYPGKPEPGGPRLGCVAGRWPLDALPAAMLSHALELAGVSALLLPAPAETGDVADDSRWEQLQTVCITHHAGTGHAHTRVLCRRWHRRWPHLRIVVMAWGIREHVSAAELLSALHDDAEQVFLGFDAALDGLMPDNAGISAESAADRAPDDAPRLSGSPEGVSQAAVAAAQGNADLGSLPTGGVKKPAE